MKNIIKKSSKGFAFKGAGVEVKAGRTFITGRPYASVSVSDNTMNLAVGFVTLAAGAKAVTFVGKKIGDGAKTIKAHFTGNGKPAAEDFMEQ